VVLIAPGDYPQINAISMVTADLLQRLGMNLELVSTDWGTLVQRRASREPVERGGWSMIHTTSSGQTLTLPVFHLFLRANGPNAGSAGRRTPRSSGCGRLGSTPRTRPRRGASARR
jgi:peptide/nickel transport system substrate-binding protein